AGHHPHRADGPVGGDDGGVALARRQQRVHADRPNRAGGVVGEERDLDRRVRARAGIRRAHAAAGGGGSGAVEIAPDPDDLAGLRDGCAAAGALHWRGLGDAPRDGHRGVRRNDRRHCLRPVPDAGVLCADAQAGRQPCTEVAWRGAPPRSIRWCRGMKESTMKKNFVFAPLMLALVLAGCATPPPIDTTKLPATPAAFKEGDGRWTVAAPADAQPRGEWWKAFADPVLDDLVARAEARNDRIQIAAARLAQARALLRSADAERLPQVGIGAGAVRGTDPSTGTTPSTLISAGANFSYEVDLFGRLARASDAASLDAQARDALLQSARLLVQADVAQTYFALRALDIENAILRDTVAAYRDTLRLTERRYQAGDVAELDVARVRTEAASTESDALAVQRQRSVLEHALAVLVGEPASNFALTGGEW